MKFKTQILKLKTPTFAKASVGRQNSKFRFLPDVATADIAYEAYGKNYNELFENAGLALEEIMVDTKTVEEKIEKNITIEKDTYEDLLFSFLEELVYLKDTERLVFKKFNCKVNKMENAWKMENRAYGEKINPKKHKLRADIKAVTKHLFKIELLANRSLRSTVVLDI